MDGQGSSCLGKYEDDTRRIRLLGTCYHICSWHFFSGASSTFRGNVDGGVALNSEMTLCRRAVVSGWTGVEKLHWREQSQAPSRSERPASSMRGWTGEGEAGQNQMLHVASNQKAVNLDIKMFGTALLLMLPYPSHLARTKLSKGNKQPYLPVCTNRKGPRQSTRLITALKGPALPRPRPCVLTTIRANLSLVDPAHQRRGTNTARQARSRAAWKGTQASGTQSVQLHGGSAQTFSILYRRLVPQSDDGLDGSLVDVAVGPWCFNFQASTSNMLQRSASRTQSTSFLLDPCRPFLSIKAHHGASWRSLLFNITLMKHDSRILCRGQMPRQYLHSRSGP